MTSAKRSSRRPEYGTDQPFIDLARATLGGITLDPFSDRAFNERVRADRIITACMDAFRWPWFKDPCPPAREILAGGLAPMAPDLVAQVELERARPGAVSQAPPNQDTALVNPPGDPRGDRVKRAWELTWWHWHHGWIAGGAVFVMFNIGQLQTLQRTRAGRSPLAFPLLIPFRRAAYRLRSGELDEQPPHASALALLPPTAEPARSIALGIWNLAGSRLGEVRS